MNPENNEKIATGAVADSGNSCTRKSSVRSSNDSEDVMKRTAAKELIEKLYYQLMDGCGDAECSNEQCASGSGVNMDKNQAAAHAITLVKSNKVKLCVGRPVKVPRQALGGASSSQPCTSDVAKESSPPGEETMTTSRTDTSPAPLHSSSSEPLVSAFITADSVSADMERSSIDEKGKPSKSFSLLTPISLPKSGTKQVRFLTEEDVYDILEKCKVTESYSVLIRTIGQVFSDVEALNLSFHKTQSSADEELLKKHSNLKKEDLRSMGQDLDKDSDDKESVSEADNNETELQSVENIDTGESSKSYQPDITVDVTSVRRVFHRLFSIPGLPFQNALINATISLSESVQVGLTYKEISQSKPNFLNLFVIIMEIPNLQNTEYLERAFPSFCKATAQLSLKSQANLVRYWSLYEVDRLRDMLFNLQQLITVKVLTDQVNSRHYTVGDDEIICAAAKLMKMIYYASIVGGRFDSAETVALETQQEKDDDASMQVFLQGAIGGPKELKTLSEDSLAKELDVRVIDCREPLIPHEDFINEAVSEQLESDHSFQEQFCLNYSMLLTTAAKVQGMYFEHRVRMWHERRFSMLQSLIHEGSSTPYLRLRVRRDHLIDDALVRLEIIAMDHPGDLKKQLYVEFEGEQGIDEGGVSKEFFQLVVDQLFNPDYAMFTYDHETHLFWFNPTSFESDRQFTLIGIVLGLAIYNNVILDIHFPMVVYRKLLGKMGTFEDLKTSHATFAKSLQELLDYEGDDIEDVFLQTFRIGYSDIFGSSLYHDLKENGGDIPVTQSNKQEFVNLYVDFLLNKMISRQFRAFKTGFQMVTDESPLKLLFRPEEVEILVCGSKNFDFNELENSTQYDGGYDSRHRTIRQFWDIVHEFSDEQKKALLMFTTGSDRVPCGGLSKLKLIIARNGPDSDRLPTAHTCFNVLLLPEYSSKEKLKERLTKAITYAKGFGML